MDPKTITLQNARVATFLSQVIAVLANFHVIVGNLAEKRQKFNFLQRLKWDRFILNSKDRPFFRRHLRMSYSSFCVLLELLQNKIDQLDD